MGTTERVSLASDGAQANHHSYDPSISSNGRYITFYSSASNLVDNDTSGQPNIVPINQPTLPCLRQWHL